MIANKLSFAIAPLEIVFVISLLLFTKVSICKTCSSFDNSKISEDEIRGKILLQIERIDN